MKIEEASTSSTSTPTKSGSLPGLGANLPPRSSDMHVTDRTKPGSGLAEPSVGIDQ